MMNYYAPTLLTKMTLDAAHSTELELLPTLLGILRWHGHDIFTAPVVAQMHQSDLPQFFSQAQAIDAPVLMLCLPDAMRGDIQSLATSPLFPVNVMSGDLLERTTCLVLAGDTHEIQIDAGKSMQTISGIGVDGLYLILVCDGQLWIMRHPVDEDWSMTIGNSMMSAGINYRPYQTWTEAELAEAARTGAPRAGTSRFANTWRSQVCHKG